MEKECIVYFVNIQMHECSHPSFCLVRVSRWWFQRIVYSEVYLCSSCGSRLGMYHRFLSALVVNNVRFLFSRYSHCVSCGSSAIDDGGSIYFLSKNPLGWILLLAAAPLRECSPCGRQFFDWRPARPLRSKTAFSNRTASDLAALDRATQLPSEQAPQHGSQEFERP